MKPKRKLCACCGGVTPPLMQHPNQDTGYALCADCADWIEQRHVVSTGSVQEGADYLRQTYGERGVHIATKEMTDAQV